jgi:hypothetical protein
MVVLEGVVSASILINPATIRSPSNVFTQAALDETGLWVFPRVGFDPPGTVDNTSHYATRTPKPLNFLGDAIFSSR